MPTTVSDNLDDFENSVALLRENVRDVVVGFFLRQNGETQLIWNDTRVANVGKHARALARESAHAMEIDAFMIGYRPEATHDQNGQSLIEIANPEIDVEPVLSFRPMSDKRVANIVSALVSTRAYADYVAPYLITPKTNVEVRLRIQPRQGESYGSWFIERCNEVARIRRNLSMYPSVESYKKSASARHSSDLAASWVEAILEREGEDCVNLASVGSIRRNENLLTIADDQLLPMEWRPLSS